MYDAIDSSSWDAAQLHALLAWRRTTVSHIEHPSRSTSGGQPAIGPGSFVLFVLDGFFAVFLGWIGGLYGLATDGCSSAHSVDCASSVNRAYFGNWIAQAQLLVCGGALLFRRSRANPPDVAIVLVLPLISVGVFLICGAMVGTS